MECVSVPFVALPSHGVLHLLAPNDGYRGVGMDKWTIIGQCASAAACREGAQFSACDKVSDRHAGDPLVVGVCSDKKRSVAG